ncbi:MAG: HAD-IA family hydrolase, partial [Xanthomonadales bacterium]
MSGSKTAAHFTQLDWVQQQCREKLDFDPFPGTLNLDIDPDYFPLISELQRAPAIELIPQRSDGCAGKVIPLSIEGIRGAIIIPEDKVNIHGENIIEVMAPVGLRESLGLADGHLVTLFADRPGKAPLDAVIFDLDGTLLDSVGIYFQIVGSVLERLGFPQVSMDVIREAAEDGKFEWKNVLPKSADINQSGLLVKIQSMVEEVYRPMFEIEAKPFPGMKAVVDDLAAAGIKLGIVTSTPREQMDFKLKPLKQNGTLSHFEAIVSSCDVVRKKPAPDPMIECCRQLDVKLENSVYVGDSRSDIKSGRSAGMKTIAVLSGFDDLQALSKEYPDAVINS